MSPWMLVLLTAIIFAWILFLNHLFYRPGKQKEDIDTDSAY